MSTDTRQNSNVMQTNWNRTIEAAQQFRRVLHQQPELSWQEHNTAALVRSKLTELDIEWRSCAKTGTVARLNTSGSGPHIALRGDMDALPIDEQTNLPWASKNQGHMHACGHDGHTATLIATANWLKYYEDELPGPVSLIFQPAEEGGHGAKVMIEDGALTGIDVIYGWHNWPAIPYGKLACPDNIVMCGNATFAITVNGVGGHASQPEACQDPVLAAAAITLNLQQIVSRRIAPQQTVVISVSSINAPSGPTITPASAQIDGSIRVPDRTTLTQVSELIEQISQHTASSYGVTCNVVIQPYYNATINHAEPATKVRSHWANDWGEQALNHHIALPIMASEDFSYYLEKIPGAFALIGADDGDNHHHSCHSPYYDFNDKLIAKVLRLYGRLAGAPVPDKLRQTV